MQKVLQRRVELAGSAVPGATVDNACGLCMQPTVLCSQVKACTHPQCVRVYCTPCLQKLLGKAQVRRCSGWYSSPSNSSLHCIDVLRCIDAQGLADQAMALSKLHGRRWLRVRGSLSLRCVGVIVLTLLVLDVSVYRPVHQLHNHSNQS